MPSHDVYEDELDLSLNDLREVPVEKIKNLKITSVDLSCNHIEELSWDFTQLTQLVKIDLSKNKLNELPESFGDLINLKHLDLYNNNLQHLPISFRKLKKLKWLDLKNNPLHTSLQEVTGKCLKPQDFQDCARKMVSFFGSVHAAMEKEKIDMENLKKKEIPKSSKVEHTIKESKKKKAEVESKKKTQFPYKDKPKITMDELSVPKIEDASRAANMNGSYYFSKFIIYTIFSICLMYIFCLFYDIPVESISTTDVKNFSNKLFKNMMSSLFNSLDLINNYIPAIRGICLNVIHSGMIYVTKIASDIETFLSHYVWYF